MSVTLLASARGAPGVTTTSIAVAAWMERGVLVEADPDGGVIAARYRLGREPGLVTLAAGPAGHGETLLDHAQRLPGGLPVVVAPESAERATHVWRTAGPTLLAALAGQTAVDVVVDAGRVGPSSPALAIVPHASLVAIVARPIAEELLAAADRVRALARVNQHTGLLLAGEGPYTPQDVSDELGCEVLGTVAHDPRGAEALAGGGGGKALTRSALMRSARGLALNITDGVTPRAASTAVLGSPRAKGGQP